MQKLILNKKDIICVGIYVLLAFDLLLVVPLQIRSVLGNNVSLHKVKVRISQYNRDKADGDDFLKEKERLSRDILSLQGRIIPRRDVSSVSAYISSKAKDNNVDIFEVTAGTEEEYKNSGGNRYYYLPLKIEAESGYHDLGRFLNALSMGEYYLDTEEILVQGNAPYHKTGLIISILLKE